MACVWDPGVVVVSSNTFEVVRLKLMMGIMKARKLMMVTRVMVGNRSVGGEGPWLGPEEVLIYLRAGREVVVMLMETPVVSLRRYPELNSWL